MEIGVLLVDDEKELVEHMAERLQTRGFSVDTVLNGESAIEYLKNNQVDVVVLDLQMPGMDGVETLRGIKRLRPEVKVIMLTGHGTIETALEGRREGAEEYLIKPCDIIQLAKTIRSLVPGALVPGKSDA